VQHRAADSMLKVAIVGCGKIADAHASVIQRIKGCEIVGVCDREPLMAKQLYQRFPVKGYFRDLNELLDGSRPDVVHITTPPASHFDIASRCLERGCHVYVEKPFTVDGDEALRLVQLAEKTGRKLTVGHNDQFTPVANRMRELIKTGYLGGPPVHMESSYCYDLTDPSYAKALLGDENHWVRKLPGRLLQNIISHGIARISEFLTSDTPRILAHGFVSPVLKRINETNIIDELRVIMWEADGRTAYFTFSTQMQPSIHEFRIYGPKNGLVLDQDHETLMKTRGAKFKSYADKFIPPLLFAKQHLGNWFINAKLFAKNEFHIDSGMKFLVESFYSSIQEGAPAPIPYREILRTAKIMDAVFEQLNIKQPSPAASRVSLCEPRIDGPACERKQAPTSEENGSLRLPEN
jgi:predicted dehydrogenase